MVYMIGMSPVWSSVADALAKNDYKWINAIRNKLYTLLGLAVIGEIIMILLSKYIIRIWMGEEFTLLNYNMVICVAIFDIVKYMVCFKCKY